MIRVLHVDDDPETGEITASSLERRDERFDVVSELSASDALDRLANEDVDCILSDYQLPRMDGIEFLTAVRESYPDLPFILFTRDGSESVASDALSAGATEYLQKDTTAGQYALLANRITNAVESYRSQQRETYLESVHSIVRDINRALVRSSSREEIETRVCEIIEAVAPVRFVAVSAVDPGGNRLVPREWIATGNDDLAEIDTTSIEPADRPRTPHERAIAEHEVVVSRDVRSDPAFAQWRETVRESDVRSLVVVPLVYDGILYGLLTIYAARMRAIDEEIVATLRELGDDIAYAIDAIETREELAESEAAYRTLTEAASDAIVTIDASNTVVYANPAVERLFGYAPDELEGSSLSRLMPDTLGDRHHEALDRYLRTGERYLDWSGVELTGQHRDGTEIPLSVSFGEFERHGEQFFTGVLRDITRRKRQTTELRRQNERLDEFAGIVAHDLRNPLNVVEGRVELARDECESEHLDIAAEALERTDALIQDILTFARQGQPVDETEPVPLPELTAETMIEGEDVHVETDPALDPLVGQRSRVQELIDNLVRNAIEHAGSDVTIRIERLADGFAVEDDGPGIPEDERDDVFEPGYTSKEAGTGFGLNIVETIVDAHGWEIEVTDGRDGGARFEITGVEFAS